MTYITLPIPEALKHRMKEYRYIDWPEIARTAIFDKVKLLEKIDRLLSKSPITEEDSVKYGRMIKKRQWEKTKKLIS